MSQSKSTSAAATDAKVDTVAFYRSYHSNIWNVLVHAVWVPVIEICSFGLVHHFTGGWFASRLGNPHINLLSAYMVLNIPRYIAFDSISGVIRGLILLGNYYVATQVFDYVKMLIALKTIGWILQFLAHRFFEGRAPALLDNAKQALTMAPYFVLLETMFAFGYKPSLQKAIDQRADTLRAEWEKKHE